LPSLTNQLLPGPLPTDQARYYLLTHPADGSVLAQLMITFEWSDWRAAQVWWVQSVYVPPQHRENGYYR